MYYNLLQVQLNSQTFEIGENNLVPSAKHIYIMIGIPCEGGGGGSCKPDGSSLIFQGVTILQYFYDVWIIVM